MVFKIVWATRSTLYVVSGTGSMIYWRAAKKKKKNPHMRINQADHSEWLQNYTAVLFQSATKLHICGWNCLWNSQL